MQAFCPKIEEFPFLVHKLSVMPNCSTIKTAVKNGVKNVQAAGYNGAGTVVIKGTINS